MSKEKLISLNNYRIIVNFILLQEKNIKKLIKKKKNNKNNKSISKIFKLMKSLNKSLKNKSKINNIWQINY